MEIITSFENFTENVHFDLRNRYFLTISILQNIVKFSETFFTDPKTSQFSSSKVS